MNITKAKYFKDFDENNVSINATIDGQDMSVPLDLTTDTTKQSLNG